MARLRAPDGCPWDQEQTFDTIPRYTLEEVYELFDALDRRDWKDAAEELGDYLLQAVFYGQMGADAGHFTIADALDQINAKLVRRHPHVFGDAEARTAEDVKRRWDEIKQGEKSQVPRALLDSVARAQPALAESQQVMRKAGEKGFDWPSIEPVFDKLREELDELHEARLSGDPAAVEHELGDVLSTVVNLARFLNVDAEQALRRSTARFRHRFGHIESRLREKNQDWKDTSLEEMESLWNEAKSKSAS